MLSPIALGIIEFHKLCRRSQLGRPLSVQWCWGDAGQGVVGGIHDSVLLVLVTIKRRPQQHDSVLHLSMQGRSGPIH